MASTEAQGAGSRLAAAPVLLPALGFLAGAIVIAVGLLLDRDGTRLYVPNPPFLWRYDPRVDVLVVVALVVLGAAVLAGPRLLRLPPAVFALAALVTTAAVRLALAAAPAGTGGWDRVFDPERSFEADNEYLPALPALRYGVDLFLDRFSEVVTSLPVHAAGHPPGLLLVMDALEVSTPQALAALCIAGGVLATPLLYLLGRRVMEEAAARVAALLLALSPGAAMFGVTSADGLFMTLGVVAAIGLVAAPRAVAAGAGGLALAVSSFFAWSLLAVGAWAAVLRLRREGWVGAFVVAAGCGVVLAGFYALLHAMSGFDPIGTLRGTEQVYRAGIARGRPYAFWLFGSPTAYLFTLGLPITWYALRSLGEGRSLALAIFAVIAVASVLGFTKAETERIWLFFTPFVCLAAAAALPRGRLAPVLGLLAVQALACELLYDSVW
jgi:hypothetical protein